MINTTNYGLNKPEITDYYNVEHQNENMDILDEKIKEIDDSASSAKTSVDNHVMDTLNPHLVTKSQVGLGNVDNTADANKPVSNAQREAINEVQTNLNAHTARQDNPHMITKVQVGLGNVDNTSDVDKPVSTATRSAIDTAYANSNAYTDTKINALVNGAPTTLDTLKEIADAMTQHADVVAALNDAIGEKANEAEFVSHTGDTANPHNVTKSQVGLGNVPNVATNNQTPTYSMASNLGALTSGENLSTAFSKIAKAISSAIYIVSWDASTGALVTRSLDFEG